MRFGVNQSAFYLILIVMQSPLTQPLTERVVDQDFSLSFFCQGVVLADVDRVCPITELYANGLRFNHASTYREARDERQKHP